MTADLDIPLIFATYETGNCSEEVSLKVFLAIRIILLERNDVKRGDNVLLALQCVENRRKEVKDKDHKDVQLFGSEVYTLCCVSQDSVAKLPLPSHQMMMVTITEGHPMFYV